MEETIQVLKMHRIVMSLKKLQEGLEVKWCDYLLKVIDSHGPILIKPNLERQRAVTEFPRPKNRTQLGHFLGLKTQVQVCIPGINWICKELHALTN